MNTRNSLLHNICAYKTLATNESSDFSHFFPFDFVIMPPQVVTPSFCSSSVPQP